MQKSTTGKSHRFLPQLSGRGSIARSWLRSIRLAAPFLAKELDSPSSRHGFDGPNLFAWMRTHNAECAKCASGCGEGTDGLSIRPDRLALVSARRGSREHYAWRPQLEHVACVCK